MTYRDPILGRLDHADDPSTERRATTAPCPHCVRGTVPGTNGSRWRCAACNGTGRITLTNDNARTAS